MAGGLQKISYLHFLAAHSGQPDFTFEYSTTL